MIRSWTLVRSWTLALAFAWGLTMVAGMATPHHVAAQDTPSADAPTTADPESDRAQSFRAMTGPATEDVPGGTLLIGAYALVWLFVLLLILRIGSVSNKVSVDLARLEQSLADQEEG